MSDSPTEPGGKKAADEETKKRQREAVEKLIAEPPVTSEGSAEIGGRRLAYTVTAAFIPVMPPPMSDKFGEPQSAVFTIAYALKDAPPGRPLCFVYNGGPGSSSVWLHLGAVGPRRVAINDDGTMPPPPFRVADNGESWFEHFDLVFVDPPHTGFSLASGEDARKSALSVDGDVDALAEVMRTWLARYRRWDSALYLAGESYGTTRAAALANKLQDIGIALSGVILVSCAMDLQTLVFTPRNELPYALFLPAFAAVAHYHGKLARDVAASGEAARAAAEAFVVEEYLSALHAGARLDGARRERTIRRFAELSGLAPAFVAEKNLRVSDHDFFFELLRGEGKIVGRLDARVTGPMAAHRTRAWEFDPAMEALVPPYTMAVHTYFAELGISADRRYEVFSEDVNKAWDWNRRGPGGEPAKGNNFTTTGDDLAKALRRNRHLRVLVASGYYDLGTPYSATNWSLAQLDAPPDALSRVEHHYYGAGHMMYTREDDLKKMKADLGTWLGRA